MSKHFGGSKPPSPTVSVGMPVYNSSAWVASSIESILGQTWKDLELVICDNASTDATLSICEDFANRDARVRLYRNPQNVGANRNYLAVLRHARGAYFKWASSNDLCHATFIERCVRALEREPSAVLAFTQAALFENDLSDARPYDRDLLLTADTASERYATLFRIMGLNNAFNGLVRREALSGAAPLGNFQRADIALMAELALKGKFLVIPERLFFRRMSLDSATKMKSAREVDEHIEPQIRRPMRWQNWRFHLALVRAALRQRPVTRESVAALMHALRQMRWARNDLARDIRRAVQGAHW